MYIYICKIESLCWTAEIKKKNNIVNHLYFHFLKSRMILDVACESNSVMSNSLWAHELYSPWNSPARILEWVAVPFSRASSQPRDRTQVSHIAGGFFTSWATKEAWLALFTRRKMLSVQ